MEVDGLAGQLHWTLIWALWPLAALTALSGASRPELGRAWRWVLVLGGALAAAAVGLRIARYGLLRWQLPGFVWAFAPVGLLALAVRARESILLWLVFMAGLPIALAGWIAWVVGAWGGPAALANVNDATLLLSVPLLLAGLWKHIATPTPEKPEAAPAITPEPDREALLQEHLARDEAQEAADKYTRD